MKNCTIVWFHLNIHNSNTSIKFIMINTTGQRYWEPQKSLVQSTIWITQKTDTKFKYGPQSSHFNKAQYALHYLVKHSSDQTFSYFYHLSDDLKRDFTFTKTAIDGLSEKNGTTTILHFKSDNCSVKIW